MVPTPRKHLPGPTRRLPLPDAGRPARETERDEHVQDDGLDDCEARGAGMPRPRASSRGFAAGAEMYSDGTAVGLA